MGFRQVVCPDDKLETNLQEDFQIHDHKPTLLLEVKGLGGLPREDDTQQVNKYVVRRMRDWGRTDVRGVFVVNAQRQMPPLDRSHPRVFTEAQLSDAQAQQVGLTTTWDLFRLVRGMIRWNWPPTTVQDVLYGVGRLPSIPSHYRAVGEVANVLDKVSVLSIKVSEGTVKVGDRIGFLLPDGFLEEDVASLEKERKPVNEARPGDRVGHKTAYVDRVKEGMAVYLVTPPSQSAG